MSTIEDEGVIVLDTMDNPDKTKLKIEEFARNNKVKSNNKRRVCGDDRFEVTQSEGATRIFGGDEGVLTAVKAAANKAEIDISIPDLVVKYEEALKELFGKDVSLEVHTSTHALENGELGCGFMERAINVHALHEFLSNEEAREIHEAILARPHKEVVLEGNHDAKSVLRVHGSELSVNSRDEHEQHFVVDVDRVVSLIESVVPLLGVYGLQRADVINQFESQMGKTAEQLAAGKPIYDFRFDEMHIPHATLSGTVPHPTLQN